MLYKFILYALFKFESLRFLQIELYVDSALSYLSFQELIAHSYCYITELLY